MRRDAEQRIKDALEDAGLYSPDPDLVEAIYEDAVRPMRDALVTVANSHGHGSWLAPAVKAAVVIALDGDYA